ncbi:hypothetical protein P879_03680 [Paragonimus westermani]|uniref:Uncharacterized protein n=1 Tax=Paragonimus westermani TaxID=34504 RepID=A0A8T0DPA2_9TREM|nr:hypothetical protein P879_03680 [Paragonimus westermani]
MFWTSFAEPYLANDLLIQPDLTIQQLLDDDNILQRCREKDVRLVDFLCRDENVEYLVDLICNPLVPDELDTGLFRYPSLACEIVTSDIDRLLDCIVQPASSGTPVVDQNGSSILPDGLGNQSGMVIDAHSSSPVSCSYGGDEARQSKSDSNMSLSSPVATEAKFKASIMEKNVIPQPDARSSVLDESSAVQPRPRLDRLLAAIKSSLNPLSASFLSRVLVHLAVHRGQVVIPYMRSYPDFLEHLLSHFDLAAIPDLLIQLAQQERGLQHSIFEWFIESRLVPHLIQEFAPTKSWEIHQSVAHCLIQLITILRSYLSNNAPPCGPDSDSSAVFDSGLPATSPYAMLVSEDERAYVVAARLLDILESEETVNAILDRLTNSDTVTTSIAVNCIEVLIALMDKRRPETSFPVPNGDGAGGIGGSGMEMEPFLGGNLFGGGFLSGLNEPLSGSGPTRLGTKSDLADKARIARACTNLANAVRPRLGQLHTLLQTYHQQTCNQMPTTVGLLDPPLGRFRLALVQFFALLVALPTETGLAEGLVKVGVVSTLLELFERYAYNTLLHQAVINFLFGVFTHARVVDSSRTNRKDQKGIASDTSIATSTPTGKNPSDLEANPITSNSRSSIATKETCMDVDADVTSSAQLKFLEKPTATFLDDAFATIMKDNGLIDWCLRLSPLSADLPPKNNATPVNASKPRPKPGYAGHLWQLANFIEEARKGSRSDFVTRVFQELTPTSLTSWDAFVTGDLSTINAQQVPDDLSDVKPSQGSNLVSLLAPNALVGNLLSQSGGVSNRTVLFAILIIVPFFLHQMNCQSFLVEQLTLFVHVIHGSLPTVLWFTLTCHINRLPIGR